MTTTTSTQTCLERKTDRGTAFVWFQMVSETTIRMFTAATWTHYEHDEAASHDEARGEYARLVGEGWAAEVAS